jgi:hypothetical protein
MGTKPIVPNLNTNVLGFKPIILGPKLIVLGSKSVLGLRPNVLSQKANEHCEVFLHTFTIKICSHKKIGWKWNYYVVIV